MSNPVLDRLRQERAKHVDYIAQLLAHVDENQRDLVDAETAALTSARERIGQIDAQIEPLEAFEATRSAHEETVAAVQPTIRSQQQGATRLGVQPRPVVYPTAGHFVVDKIRSMQHWNAQGMEVAPDRDALQRVSAALQTRAAGDVAQGVH